MGCDGSSSSRVQLGEDGDRSGGCDDAADAGGSGEALCCRDYRKYPGLSEQTAQFAPAYRRTWSVAQDNSDVC